jgi:hypothetical protein
VYKRGTTPLSSNPNTILLKTGKLLGDEHSNETDGYAKFVVKRAVKEEKQLSMPIILR